MTSTTTTRRYNRPRTTTNKQAANKAMSILIDTLVGMKDARIAEIAQLGRTMNKRCKDIFAYFDHYILWCLIHAANIRHTINAL
ncbi:transposase [Corynebacterium diphtheriae bv. mitis]|uniref:transposase n=2 Tax=Corynebacterium diphtheriae TaxID=1717 RepID=UPI000246924F|nr:transposase [Corynebacterium diphtheriae]AEX79794.1 transposase-like protein [Corynebacterium diphtheriae HC03]AEX82089.1 transposase-like protein [Corynebacterium diphtheriae HC04]AEX84260.1 transposase-like protein [Corynebacterium diphtheriae VA01]KJJ59960.1 transposase [Corynebacterium diphtheriae]MBG9246950.1 transposase [Corynebacterium diphtheriae bv. mitis]